MPLVYTRHANVKIENSLCRHVMYKHVELGGFVGMCIIGPLIGAIRGRSLSAVARAAKTVMT